MKQPFLRKYPFSYYLIAAIFAILMIAVTALIGISYLSTEQTLRDNANALELQTEDSLVAVFRTKEEGLRIFDDSLNLRMEESFPLFLAEYERAGREPANMDLAAVKEALGEDMDLYVIDANATIISSTYAADVGLRFHDYAPYFADYLDRIRLSEGIHPDRVVAAKTTGEMKKYAYLPTPDHQYILELGLTVEDVPVASFRYLDEELIGQVEQANPYLVKARVFETTLRERINDTSVDIDDPALKTLLAEVLASRTSRTIANPESGITTRYLFVDLGNDNYGSDLSRIIELTYSDQPIHEALASSISFYLSLGLVALVGCALIAIVSMRSLTRPIGKMVEDVNTIAGGDLDHPLTPPIGEEMIVLEESISEMVARLKTIITELRTSEENYRTLVQSANSIILRFDTGGNVTFINEYAQKFFGYTAAEIIGKNILATIVPPYESTGKDLATKIHDLILHPENYEVSENENTRKDGSRVWIAWTNQPLYDQQGTLVEILSIGNDITRLIEAENEIQALNSELEQRVADRTRQLLEVNRNLESFTYSVSHDLRAPLRAISGYSTILLQDLPGISEKDRKYLELLRQNAHEMGRLIDDLLNFSKLGQRSLQVTAVDPAAIARELIQDFRNEPGNRWVEFIVESLPACKADPVLFKQVLANLLSNAIKFSRCRDPPIVEIGSAIRQGRQVYFVRDNGVGFDMRYADKIFGVFERLHSSEEYEGTGVGLAIVYRIIELHGGRIWVESEPDRGTTFYFTCG
ncbi:MAG: PAS domain S-box protein [Methanomicrobiales archaeon]|nr:PAS domain S-box protein [Methanomicrobiales archaeon]